VRVIVDALSKPHIQTQSMYFDLKQHGIEPVWDSAGINVPSILFQYAVFLMPAARIARLGRYKYLQHSAHDHF
jgi:hypothetical protein